MLRKQCVTVSVGFVSSGELLIRQEWTVSADQEPAEHPAGALGARCVTRAAAKRAGAAEGR